ncbi:MAG: hypothetical protein O3A60_00255 [Planctomycetota bacterium]|nr:hypothetical protein [Planctomycetota bacterium]
MAPPSAHVARRRPRERRGRRFVLIDGEAYARLTGATPTLKDVILHGPSLEVST